MSFEIETGDLFASVKEGHILHGCNAQGVMGSGVARIVRDMYPIAYQEYRRYHKQNGLSLGEVIPVIVADNLVIQNGITQDSFGHSGVFVDYDALFTVFLKSIEITESNLIECKDIHLPLVGGGLGGGDKDRIIKIMNTCYSEININTTLWLL